MAPSQKLVLAPSAIFRGNTVHGVLLYILKSCEKQVKRNQSHKKFIIVILSRWYIVLVGLMTDYTVMWEARGIIIWRKYMQLERQVYWESPEISPGLICGERPLSKNKIDHIYKTMVLTVGTWSKLWGRPHPYIMQWKS